MKNEKYMSIPIEISQVERFSNDESLIPVDIKVMHDGLNLNDTTFYSKAIEGAKETLKNKPILGYIKKEDGNSEKDFSGHEMEIVLDDAGAKVVYLERPLGTIPETNNYSIITEDEKNFVACRGYLWKEYLNDGYEILKENSSKSVSMEIAVDDYESNDDGSINITKFRYLGVTILGDDVPPAMEGAKLEVVGQFNKNFSDDFYSKIETLNNSLKDKFSIEVEGGESVDKEQKFNEEEVEENKEVENNSLDEDNNSECEDEQNVKEENSLEEDYELLESKYNDLKSNHDELEKKFTALEEEASELREFKINVETSEKHQIIENFSHEISEEQVDDLKEKCINMSKDELEKELFYLVGKKKYSMKEDKSENKKIRIKTENTETNPYGSAAVYFER